jgi:hypothetical protein
MKTIVPRIPSLLVPACAVAFGMFAATSPALAENAPFTLTDAPAVSSASSSPLMMSAAALDAVADVPKGAPQAEMDDGWHFRLSFPIWVPGFSGNMTVRGHELSGGNSAGDTLTKLGDTLDFAATFHFEAEKGRWGAFVDTMYISFKEEKDLRTGGTAEATEQGFIGELGGFFTFLSPKPGDKGWGAFRADALAGVRVTYLELGAKTNSFDVSASHTLIDPIIGARMELGLTDWLSYKLRGDIGGFDVGCTFAWNIDTAFEFHLAKWFDIDLGYRWLDDDFKHGAIDYHALISGPYLTLQFRF